MSRKGNSGNNAACEGFFGRMKTEMYYPLNWDSTEELRQAINSYNNHRVKSGLKRQLWNIVLWLHKMSKKLS